ncbi:hypothetical protein GNF10_23460 [Nostoc sp. UCD121]|uniref:hypothetical protein n=1 Tax=unclassified Nostoc TaxID=2593658 RepID=UPI00162A0A08|nr:MULTISPECIES: hypothetical protein [unclassified Nostoc]MBC1218967.1 hypothetical protein [Nostoc sp. UCD120]MBC1278842.1 hypothetical protein [Nostoc sp. UCD121]MBC1294387.1 hypothetical protein [Nostoc sp. UCD122]
MKTQRKQSQSTGQKLYRQTITMLLLIQTILIGVNAENRIQQGDSQIEVLIWMVKESISLVKQASSLQEKQKKSLLPTHRRSED